MCDLSEPPNDRRFQSRWPEEESVRRPRSRAVPAQIDERGREMATRVKTLEESSGTMIAY